MSAVRKKLVVKGKEHTFSREMESGQYQSLYGSKA